MNSYLKLIHASISNRSSPDPRSSNEHAHHPRLLGTLHSFAVRTTSGQDRPCHVHLMRLSTRPRRLHARYLTMQETVQFLDTGTQELDRHA